MKIYLASSWRNDEYLKVLGLLRGHGYEVYDFTHPGTSFHWREIDPDWTFWNVRAFIQALDDERAQRGFDADMTALEQCDVCVLVLPCNRSAHTELGVAIGMGKKTIIYIPPIRNAWRPELMYGAVDHIVDNYEDLLAVLATYGDGTGVFSIENGIVTVEEPPC